MEVTNDPATKPAAHPAVSDIQKHRTAKTERADEQAAALAASRLDGVELSDAARERLIAEQAVEGADEVRADVVARMKLRARNDALRVDSEKIAEKMTGDGEG